MYPMRFFLVFVPFHAKNTRFLTTSYLVYHTPTFLSRHFYFFLFTLKSAPLHKSPAIANTAVMHKKLLSNALPFLLSSITFCACHAPAKQTPKTDNTATQHSPTPLPIFPDEENALPDAPPSAEPDLWDVSSVEISHIDKTRKLVAFTFDDAPARRLENVMAVYADFNEKNPDCIAAATLFLNGCRFDHHSKTLLAAALALGFELGNHTYSHADLTTLSAKEAAREIARVDELLSHIDGKDKHLFRPPYGKMTSAQKGTAKTPIISWTIDTLDWTGASEEFIYDTVMQNKFSGAIVLMHDGYENTVKALKRLLPDLKTAGYQVVSVSQMSKAHNCPLYNGKEYIRARKR